MVLWRANCTFDMGRTSCQIASQDRNSTRLRPLRVIRLSAAPRADQPPEKALERRRISAQS